MNYYEEINLDFAEKFKQKVLSSESIVISSHKSPDDDSISSTLSVYTYLIDYLMIEESKVKICYTNEINDKWKYFKYFDKINFVDDILNHVDENDLLILVDGNSWDRFSRKTEFEFKGFSICIDHHPLKSKVFDLCLIAKDRASTAEVIYKLFYEDVKLTKEVCETLLLGIMGDTGNFRYINQMTADDLIIGNRLIVEGNINIDSLQGEYQKIDENSFACLTEIMKNTQILEIENWPKFIYSYISTEYIADKSISDNNVSEASSIFTNYLKSIDGIKWGLVASPRSNDKTVALSLRSEPGSVCVRDLMERMGVGGGHDRAAGGKMLVANPQEAINRVVEWLKVNEPVFS